jgi:hypothetical protein
MPELIAAYPEAKVVIAEREPDKWVKSVDTTVRASMRSASAVSMVAVIFFDRVFFSRWIPMIDTIMKGVFGPKGIDEDDEKLKRIYSALHEEVRQLVPAERRLEYHLGDGWENLCKFLGKDVPDKPFPHANDSKVFVERFQVMVKLGKERALKTLMPIFGVVGAVVAGGVGLYIAKLNS